MNDPLADKELRSFLRAYDPDRYNSALFARREVRDALMVLYAFNADLARIPDIVSEPALGEIRLQWWRDVIEGDNDGGRAPLAESLLAVIRNYELSRPLVLGMIDARSADIDGGGFKDLQALKAYLYKSEGAVFELAARIEGDHASSLQKAARHAAVGYGLARLMRDIPRDAPAGRVMIPLSILADAGMEPEFVLAGQGEQELKAVIGVLAVEARAGLKAFREAIGNFEKKPATAFSYVSCASSYLGKLLKPSHDPYYEVVDINPLVRFLKIWRGV